MRNEALAQASDILQWLSLGVFVFLALAALKRWRKTRQAPGAWAALTFSSLAIVVIAGRILPEDADPDDMIWLVRGLIAILVLFPYLLYRFTAAIARPSRRIEWIATLSTMAVIAITFSISHFPKPDQPRTPAYMAYTLGIVGLWIFLFTVVGLRLWLGGRGKPTLVRRRVRWMATGAVGMNVAVIMGVASPGSDATAVSVAGQAVSLFCAVALLIGLAPPRMLRLAWRSTDDGAGRELMMQLMSAETPEQVAETITPFAVRVLGVHGVALVDASGTVIGRHGVSAEAAQQALSNQTSHDRPARARIFSFEGRFGTLLAWTDEYRPFFAPDDAELLQTLGITADLVLERCAKIAYERRFIANAAHELRTPLTALSGLSVTLATRRHQMSEAQVNECFEALERQGDRTRVLIENLLDLAQLEHGRHDANPSSVPVAEVAERALEIAPAPPGRSVRVSVDPSVIALADDARLEQMLVNLLTNAYRYGGPNVTLEAFSDVGGVLVVVSDDGDGVPSDLLPQLFEPFGRGSVGSGLGSGLGLAIVRRLVTSYGGEIWYEPARPRGARFTIKLPKAA